MIELIGSLLCLFWLLAAPTVLVVWLVRWLMQDKSSNVIRRIQR